MKQWVEKGVFIKSNFFLLFCIETAAAAACLWSSCLGAEKMSRNEWEMWDFNSGWQTARQRTNQRPVSRSRDHSGPMIVTRVSDRILMLPPSIIKLTAPVFHNINVTSLLSYLSEFLPTSAGAGQGRTAPNILVKDMFVELKLMII